MTPRTTACLLLAALLDAPAIAQEPDARELFIDNCARCHGVEGDGRGVTDLDRPARSFKDGGFSYGNTPEALYRTITIGIPGTPMPGFGVSLKETERRALANYVTTLGPDVREVTAEETVLAVGDRPEIARGLLPPITEGAVSQPRGLLIGTTSGLTFEYRIDDVRLLGVRQGAFVDRRDWTGRGGTALQPLGTVVYLFEGGAPEAAFRWRTEDALQPLHAKLAKTWVRGVRAGLTYTLGLEDEPGFLVRVDEAVDANRSEVGGGFRRMFELSEVQAPATLVLELPRATPDELVESFVQLDPRGAYPPRSWNIVRRADRTIECVGVVLSGIRSSGMGCIYELEIAPDAEPVLTVLTIVTAAWNDEIRSGLGRVTFP